MEWYEGGITDAISTARDDDKLITVYVYGECLQSGSLKLLIFKLRNNDTEGVIYSPRFVLNENR